MPVELGQAGQQVVCSCGTKLDVPPLRQLRELPLAPETDDRPGSAWTTRHGVITAALILAVALAVIAGYNWFTAPSLPKFDPAARTRTVEKGIGDLTPAEGWRMWVNLYAPLVKHGLQEFPNEREPAIRQSITRHRIIAMTMLIPAGILVVVAVVTALWPK